MRQEMSTCGAVIVLIFGLVGPDSFAFAAQQIEHCGIGDVTSISEAAPQGYTQLAIGNPLVGLPDNLLRCQSRLYDDNGPDTPHVWCEQDLFLLGILLFDSYKLLGLDRETVAAFLEQYIQQVSWTSSAGSTELEVSRTATKDKAGLVFGHLVYFQDYTIIGQQGLQPGHYTWEWVSRHPFFIEPGNPEGIAATVVGEVEIVSHQEHLARVAADSW